MNKKNYVDYVKKRTPESKLLKNATGAFLGGGTVCTLGQILKEVYMLFLNEKESGLLVGVTMVFAAVLLTGIGVFDKLARKAGAGLLVPITGFANAVCAPAIDCKAEGLVSGVGAAVFSIAGGVILYGTVSGMIYAFIYYIFTRLI